MDRYTGSMQTGVRIETPEAGTWDSQSPGNGSVGWLMHAKSLKKANNGQRDGSVSEVLAL